MNDMQDNLPVTFYPDLDISTTMDKLSAAERARYACADHIARYYPIHKQLNILRSGTQAEKDKMDVFINACRDWSNGENPDPAALAAIEP